MHRRDLPPKPPLPALTEIIEILPRLIRRVPLLGFVLTTRFALLCCPNDNNLGGVEGKQSCFGAIDEQLKVATRDAEKYSRGMVGSYVLPGRITESAGFYPALPVPLSEGGHSHRRLPRRWQTFLNPDASERCSRCHSSTMFAWT